MSGPAGPAGGPSWAGHPRPRVGVSSCLLGEPVRFNGGHSRDRFAAGALAGYVDWVPVCPEMEIGLGTPRETLRLESSPEGPRLVARRSGRDLTAPMAGLAGARAATLDLDGFLFKSRSPSCGTHGIPVYAGDTPVDRRGRGLFAGRIMDVHPLLPAEDEGRLRDDALREAFVERIFAHARLREFLAGDRRPGDLVAFHSRHKMQLLAHDPAAYRRIGRVVAAAGVRPREESAREYAAAFRAALAVRSTTGRHVNVLHHCLGMVSDRLDLVRRADLVEVIAAYQARQVALSVPLALLRHHVRGTGTAYLAEQTYFAPYPDELGLRNHVPR
ncbi:hypothetical protein Sru01_67680 [Sphaerisporangium rufum]|uniref:DUF1722 domain-containing protein n=1 Tax=Sphaerisporangium rufum TaxID=1381558 RepID=A0A919R8V0_9ACTN|nr:DUF523 and DUF1722 domain-containing protein [Sphaerisporangium rufum]GII81786.1 hypothetical protein Sru01_67680 [Sphaerisporangium rufum]